MKTIQDLVNQHFISMCEKGNLEEVKHWLTSPSVSVHADIDAEKGAPIIAATIKSHLHIIQYLLSSPDLQKHANVHIDNDMVFRFAIAKYSPKYFEKSAIINYLIEDYAITITPSIEKELKKYHHPELEQMLKKRSFNIYRNENHIIKDKAPKLQLIK